MKQILVTLLLATIAISCSKEKNAAGKTELLTASPWYKMWATIQVGGVTNEEPGFFFDICANDDPYIFKPDGKLEINQGEVRCPRELDYTYQYDWQFKDNETTLAINFGPLTDWQIVRLTQDSLVIRQMNASGLLTHYFAHQ